MLKNLTSIFSVRSYLVVLGVLACFLIIFFIRADDEIISAMVSWIKSIDGEERSYKAYAAAAFFTFIAALFPIPAEAPAFLNGTLFPPLNAFLLTYVFAYLGAACAYEGGRLLGYGPVSRIFGAARMARIEAAIQIAGWPALLALRLSPIMAFTALNWVSGVLALSRPVFYWTVAFGIAPGTYIFTLAPHIFTNEASFAVYLGIGFAVVTMLLGLSFLRFKARGQS